MNSMAEDAFKRIQPEEFFQQHFEKGVRPDGRGTLIGLRPVSISVGSVQTADGSSIVKQGQTIVACGVKLELAEPKATTPDAGYIVPNIELSGLCHSQFKPGPPSEEAQVVSQFLLEVILNSKLLSPKDLVIVEGKLVWAVYIDLVCLNYGGNIHDASVKALVAALRNVKVPKVEQIEDEESETSRIIVDPTICSPLKLGSLPISCTLALFDDKILVDPTDEEENFSNAKMTIVLVASSDGRQFEICHVLKAGGQAIEVGLVQKCIATAKKQAKNIQKLIEKASKVDKFSFVEQK